MEAAEEGGAAAGAVVPKDGNSCGALAGADATVPNTLDDAVGVAVEKPPPKTLVDDAGCAKMLGVALEANTLVSPPSGADGAPNMLADDAEPNKPPAALLAASVAG